MRVKKRTEKNRLKLTIFYIYIFFKKRSINLAMLENKKKYGEWTEQQKRKTDRKLCFHCHSFLNKNNKGKREEKNIMNGNEANKI